MSKLYEKTIKEIMIEYFSKLNKDDVFTTQEMVNYFKDNYPLVKESSVIAHLILFSTNSKARINHDSHKKGFCDLLYKINENKYRLYDKNKDPDPIIKGVSTGGELPSGSGIDEDEEYGFAYERDLRNFLEKNLKTIETGLKLYEEDEGDTKVKGIEYPAGGRYIDILAVDKNNDFLVIELKVSKGYDRVIGQILYYMAWVEKNMVSNGQKVRGIILCKEISKDLLLACSKISGIELFEYELSIKLNKINIEGKTIA